MGGRGTIPTEGPGGKETGGVARLRYEALKLPSAAPILHT